MDLMGKCTKDWYILKHIPGNDKKDTAHTQVGQQDVDPDVRSHGVQEGEEAAVGSVGSAIDDADAHAHEGLGEIDDLFTHVGDGEGSHGQVCPLWEGKTECFWFCFFVWLNLSWI